jgi:Restriction alleviation protein Lar
MTDETKPVELLPCPFCGVMPTVQPKGRVRSFMIFCANEECFGPHTTAAEEADARYQWNTRTTPPQQLSSTLIDRLQSCVKNVEGSFPTSYDFFRAIKNEGPGTGWRYETVGIGISDIKECLAAMTSKPYEHAMKRGRISNERHR